MTRLLRIPLVLGFAALWTAGAYAVAFLLLPDLIAFAIGAAAVGGIVVAFLLGSLTSRVPLILLAIPIAAAAMASTAYLAGAHHLRGQGRTEVVVASERCVEEKATHKSFGTTCSRHAYTLTDRSGQPVAAQLDLEDQRATFQVGQVLDVYHRSPTALKRFPIAIVDAEPDVRLAATVAVPLFVLYVLLIGIAGAVSRSAARRRPARLRAWPDSR